MKSITKIFYPAAISGCFLITGFAQAKVVDKAVATVNGETIYLSELNKNWDAFMDQVSKSGAGENTGPAWEKENKRKLLDQMIDERVLLVDARRRKLKVPEREYEEGIQQVKDRFKVDEQGEPKSAAEADRAFQDELAKEGITQKQFEDRIKDQLLVMKLVDDEMHARAEQPKEEDVHKLFDRIMAKINNQPVEGLNPGDTAELEAMAKFFQARIGERVRAEHILIRVTPGASFKDKSIARQRAEKIKADLKNGADFEELAKKHSEDPTSAQQGGDLGFFVRGQMVPEFEKTAFSLPVGGTSDIVETEFGYHIIKVLEKKAPSKLKYEDVKNELKEYLYRQSAKDKLDAFVKELRTKSDIKILYDFSHNGAQSDKK